MLHLCVITVNLKVLYFPPAIVGSYLQAQHSTTYCFVLCFNISILRDIPVSSYYYLYRLGYVVHLIWCTLVQLIYIYIFILVWMICILLSPILKCFKFIWCLQNSIFDLDYPFFDLEVLFIF